MKKYMGDIGLYSRIFRRAINIKPFPKMQKMRIRDSVAISTLARFSSLPVKIVSLVLRLMEKFPSLLEVWDNSIPKESSSSGFILTNGDELSNKKLGFLNHITHKQDKSRPQIHRRVSRYICRIKWTCVLLLKSISAYKLKFLARPPFLPSK